MPTDSWVFLVPALNEEITIGDSVERLLALRAGATQDHRDRRRLRRRDARDPRGYLRPGSPRAATRPAGRPQGKGAGAQRRLPAASAGLCPTRDRRARDRRASWTPTDGSLPTRPASRQRTSTTRGRRRPGARTHLQPHRLLTRMQDVEFSVYGSVYQAGRNTPGPPAWAGTASSTGSRRSTPSPTATGHGATG